MFHVWDSVRVTIDSNTLFMYVYCRRVNVISTATCLEPAVPDQHRPDLWPWYGTCVELHTSYENDSKICQSFMKSGF